MHWQLPVKKLLNSNISSTDTSMTHNVFSGTLNPAESVSLLHMSLQYGELQPTNGWDRFESLGHHSKFQRHLGFITATTSLNGGKPNFARCLAISWAGTLYIHFWELLPRNGICQVQNSLCVQVLHSPILAVLLRGTRVVGISQTLWHWAEGATYIRQGGHHVGHWLTFLVGNKYR